MHAMRQAGDKKVGEEILSDDPNPFRHNMTAYVCSEHFMMIFSPGEYRRELRGN
jgi:hypothetical protein